MRYRYDAAAGRRYKTVEIIVDEAPWEAKEKGREEPPLPSAPSDLEPSVDGGSSEQRLEQHNRPARFAPRTPVGVRIERTEQELQAKVKSAGGFWQYHLMVWQLPYAQAVALGLADRIVGTIAELAARR